MGHPTIASHRLRLVSRPPPHLAAAPPLTAPGQGFAQLEVAEISEVDGRLLLMFSCLGKDLSLEKRASTAGGIWVATAESPWAIRSPQRPVDHEKRHVRGTADQEARHRRDRVPRLSPRRREGRFRWGDRGSTTGLMGRCTSSLSRRTYPLRRWSNRTVLDSLQPIWRLRRTRRSVRQRSNATVPLSIAFGFISWVRASK